MTTADPTRSLASMTTDEIVEAVRERYSDVARSPTEAHGFPVGREFAISAGYDPVDIDSLPAPSVESFTGAGCPQAFVELSEGDAVLDLGCGAGVDALLYARRVGRTGSVLGLDFSTNMVSRATRSAEAMGLTNVRFVCAPASKIPVAAGCIDVVTANGILNLSPDRDAIVREIVRVLRPGGRLTFAEITLCEDRVVDTRETLADWFACVGGAETQDGLCRRLLRAGFETARVLDLRRNARTRHPASVCAVVTATKPG